MLENELLDMREHGIAVPVPALEVRIKSHDRSFGPDDQAETAAYSQRLPTAIREVYR
jgi:hypothetical protein